MNLDATLTRPTTRKDGTPFPAAELKHTLLSMKTPAAQDWTPIGTPMLPSELTRPVNNVPGGRWLFRAVWVDTQDKSSDPLDVTFDVPTANPGQGTLTISVRP